MLIIGWLRSPPYLSHFCIEKLVYRGFGKRRFYRGILRTPYCKSALNGASGRVWAGKQLEEDWLSKG